MKKLVFSALATALLALSACAPLSGKNPVPDPVPDHGGAPSVAPTHMTLKDCKSPYLALEVTIVGDGNKPGVGDYAVRPLHLTVSGVLPDGQPALWHDEATGKDVQYVWTKDVTTSADYPYLACAEYEEEYAPALDVSVFLVGQPYDLMRVKVWSYGDPSKHNICIPIGDDPLAKPYVQKLIDGPGTGNTAVVNCIVLS